MNEPRNTNVQVHGKDNEKKIYKGHQKHLALRQTYILDGYQCHLQKEKMRPRERKAIKSHLFIIFVSDFACFSAITMNIIVSFFLRQNLGTIMHGLLPGHLKQILFCLLSLGMSVSAIGQRHKVEQKENQGLKIHMENECVIVDKWKY